MSPYALLWMMVFGLLTSTLASAQDGAQTAEVVMVGEAQRSPQLEASIKELLLRDGITPTFRPLTQFDPELLWSDDREDVRVRVFIALPTPQLSKLYLRGPLGERFLLRELSLRSGLDELGCESVAQVVAASTQALLHTKQGLDRAAVRAALPPQPKLEAPPAVVAPPVEPVIVEPAARRFGYEMGLRGVAGWTGNDLGAQYGGGVELALTRRSKALLWRARMVFDQLAKQALRARAADADIRTSAPRLGVDVGRIYKAHVVFVGVAGGVDLIHVRPHNASDASWELADARIDVQPSVRVEVRYEWRVSWAYLGLSASTDITLVDNQYRVRDGGAQVTVAEPWRATPNLVLSVGKRAK
ncbi:MAG TPA: hypothetical protein VI299_11450 [Polyangiales bacterium]